MVYTVKAPHARSVMQHVNVKWMRFTALTQSEAEQLEQIVHAHGRLIFSIAYSILRNSHDAEDVTQEVFLRMMRYRYRLAFVRDERTFLGRVAQRMAVARRKQRNRHVSMEDIAEPVTAFRDYGQEQEALLVTALLRTLPEDLRQVLELSQVEELTSAEIAKLLRIPAGTVRSRLSRARGMLKQKWQGMMGNKYASTGQ